MHTMVQFGNMVEWIMQQIFFKTAPEVFYSVCACTMCDEKYVLQQ